MEDPNKVPDRLTKLSHYIEDVDRRVIGLMMRESRQDLKARIKALKNDQENVKKWFFQLGLRIEELKKEEDNVNEKLNKLMIEFGGTRESEIQEVPDTAPGFVIPSCSVLSDDLSFNIQELKENINALVSQICENERLLKWANESLLEWLRLKSMKKWAMELGAQLSALLVNLLIVLSESESNQVLDKFVKFKSAVEDLIPAGTGNKAFVIDRFIALLGIADKEIIKSLKQIGESSEKESKDSEIDQLFDKLINEVVHLDEIFKYQSVDDDSKIVKEALSFLTAKLEKCEQNVRDIDLDITSLATLSSFISASEDSESLKGNLKKKIDDLWQQK